MHLVGLKVFRNFPVASIAFTKPLNAVNLYDKSNLLSQSKCTVFSKLNSAKYFCNLLPVLPDPAYFVLKSYDDRRPNIMIE